MSSLREKTRYLSRREFLQSGFYAGLWASLPAGLALKGCAKKQSIPKLRTIILVSVDTLRADHLGCYGYPGQTSGYIDEFAREALLFEKCFSHAPVTSSSCASLLSGFLPHETRVFENLPLLVFRDSDTRIDDVDAYARLSSCFMRQRRCTEPH